MENTNLNTTIARYNIGQLVHDALFDFRGVVIDVDATYQESEELYNRMTPNKPPKDKPWYHVLVHSTQQRVYISEQDLEPDLTAEPINHPEINYFFSEFKDGKYVPYSPRN
jgi:heat shock protein HspQ